jgi:ABC-2 type transport system permease protein
VSGTRTLRSDEGRGSSSIYDLGYRGYEGPRLGRRSAILALLSHSVRTAYGIGRSARSKIMPVGLAVIVALPSLLALGLLALASILGAPGEAMEAISPISYASLFPMIGLVSFLFCAAQAPELFGRDQQIGALPLYFSRAVSRLDYAAARFLGLYVSVLILLLVPYLILLAGRVLVAADPVEGFLEELPDVPPSIAITLLTSAVVGSIAAAIAALTPRRAYATVAIIAIFLLPNVVSSMLVFLETGILGQVAAVLSPSDVLDGANAFLFGTLPENTTALEAGLEGWMWLVAAAAWIIGSLAILGHRYRTLTV